jgi:hypothetical protein
LDWLAGNPAEISAQAQTWRNIAGSLGDDSDGLTRAASWDIGDWTGAASDSYRQHAEGRTRTLQALARACDVMSLAVEGAGILIATVRTMVRDAIATVVSRLIVYAGELIATAGLATPVVAEQVGTLCAASAARITHWLRGLIASIRRLGRMMNDLARAISELRTGRAGTATKDGRGLQTGAELRRPRNAIDFDSSWADDAYDRIRASDDDIAAIARTTESSGFSIDDIRMIKDHVFRDEHLLDSYDAGSMARFDANPRMAEAWQRLAAGDPHPADLDLLRHERYEANHMAGTGDPSYRRAHAAALDAGHVWDPEAAANDGFGFQLPQWP